MDSLAPFIGWIKKNIFWLGCGILAIALVAMWFVTTQSLAEKTKDDESKVKSNISSAERILKVTAEDEIDAHPNSSSEAGMEQRLSETADAIVTAWRIREEAQKELLVWPAELESDSLIQFFEKYNPPERYPEILQNESKIQPGLELYGVKIPDRMNYLCGDEMLRARWKYAPENGAISSSDSKSGGRSNGSGGAGSPGGLTEDVADLDDKRYAVIWSEKNQDLWNDKMTKFQGLDDNISSSSSPTALQCYMLQQDLWILEAMFKIIRQVNGNSNANDLSSIKRLDHIAIGREAVSKLGELEEPDATLGRDAVVQDNQAEEMSDEERRAQAEEMFKKGKSAGANNPTADGEGASVDLKKPAMGGGASKAMGSRNMLKRGNSEIDSSNLPFEGRYVDLNFEPLSAQQVQDILIGKELPEQNLELIVAKRVPVRIALRMDENKIAEFMAACANSPFAFEIQQVRLNKHKPGGEDIKMAGKGSNASSAADKLRGMGNSAPGGGEDSAILLTSQDVEIRTNYDVDVEFYGIIKVYNPVRENFLQEAIGLQGNQADPTDTASTSGTNNGKLNP